MIRLRCDFPWAVYVMLDFLKNGCYYMYPLLCKQYPRITMLDLHVHGYIIADKYEVHALADYAAKQYLRIVADTLALDWKFDDPDNYDSSLGKLRISRDDMSNQVKLCHASNIFPGTTVPSPR